MSDFADTVMPKKEWYEREYMVCKDFLNAYNRNPELYDLDQEFILEVVNSMHQALSMFTGYAIFDKIKKRHGEELDYNFETERNPAECVGEYVGRITDLIFCED